MYLISLSNDLSILLTFLSPRIYYLFLISVHSSFILRNEIDTSTILLLLAYASLHFCLYLDSITIFLFSYHMFGFGFCFNSFL